MAGLEADTSSYPRATLPVSPLDTVQKLGGLQQQKLAIDQAKLDLMGSIPSTLSAYQSVADNPASILGALSDAQSGVNKGLTDLSIKDAVAKISNMQNLGSYMQQEGSAQSQYDMYNNQLKMSAGAERMAGTAELLKGILLLYSDEYFTTSSIYPFLVFCKSALSAENTLPKDTDASSASLASLLSCSAALNCSIFITLPANSFIAGVMVSAGNTFIFEVN